MQPLDELGQTARQLDVTALDVIEREGPREQPLVFLGHRHAEQDPVQPGPPGIGLDPSELEGLAVLGVETPPHVGLAHPLFNAGQVVIGEAEAPPHGLAPGEIEYLAHRHARGGEVEHLGQDAHDRIGLAQRAVGQPDLQLARAVDATTLLVVRAERRLNERREMLDVGAHDDDVARLELGVLFEEVQDGVAQHLDLPAAAVTGMDADAVVAGDQERAGVAVTVAHSGRCAVGPNIVLDPLQQCRLVHALLCRRLVAVGFRTTEDELHLAGVAAP